MRAALKRRKFTDTFKRKIVGEMAEETVNKVIVRHKLPTSARSWPRQLGIEATKAKTMSTVAIKAEGTKGGKKTVSPQMESIVYLRHAQRAWEQGKDRKAKYLSLLALEILQGG